MSGVDIGHFSLVGAWFLSFYAFVIGILGGIKRDRRLSGSARNAVLLTSVFTFLALFALAAAFINHDYSYLYVWRTSNNDMHWIYLISAVWGGMDGSMLLWAALGSIYCALALRSSEYVNWNLKLWVIPIFALNNGFFLTVVTFLTNPFRKIPSLPPDGNGLNPLLQNPSMMIHPPSLYLGFTGFVVPFAFALAALISGEQAWTRYIRHWTLIPWAFLTLGIILGGNWAYIELGWGGFWAWDPVENASFLPWLSATAFLHSVMVEERRGMLRIWNIALAILSYMLAVFGTFLTRSGVVQSVHAFAETNFGWVFLVYLGALFVFSFGLILYRRQGLRGDGIIESFISREAIFLLNNLILLGICFSTLWGVMFPVLSEAIVGEKSVVGPPFYNSVNGPLFLALLFFMGLGPLVAWKKMKPGNLWRSIRGPLISAFIGFLLLMFYDSDEPKAAVAFSFCLFIISAVLAEFRRASKNRSELVEGSAIALIRSKPRRYGGLIVHLGVAVMGIAITASTLFKIERDFVVRPGEQVEIGHYALKLIELKEQPARNYTALASRIDVFERGSEEFLRSVFPERRFYPRSEEVTTEVDIRMTLRDDLYVALAGVGEHGEAVLKVFVNPLQLWLWLGAAVVLLGTLIVIRPTFSSIQVNAEVPESVRAGVEI